MYVVKISALIKKRVETFKRALIAAALSVTAGLMANGCFDDSALLITGPETDPDTQIQNDESISVDAVTDEQTSAEDVNDTAISETFSVEQNQILMSSAASASITEVVLVTGQSNALGAETGYDPEQDAPHPGAFAFTETGWEVADLNQIWDLGWHPRNHPDTDPSNNFGFHFARTVAERRLDRVIGFILVTAPGASISHWDYETEFYLEIRNKVINALNELPSKATIDGILWHQGETDWADTDFYSNKLKVLISNFRGESWFGNNRPFICGETVESPVNNRLMALNTDGDAWTGCVTSEGAQTFLDGLHFSADGLRTIGTRYATKYLQMTEQ